MQSPFSTPATLAGYSPEMAKHMDRLDAAFKESSAQLSDTPEGQDILTVLGDIGSHLGRKLALFAQSMGGERFNARLYCVQRHGKAENERWQIRQLHAAMTDSLMGDPEELRKLISRLSALEQEKHVFLWVCALPEGSPAQYLALFKHQNGLEAIFMVKDGVWTPITLGTDAITLSLEAVLHADKQTRERWVSLLAATVKESTPSFKAELAPFLAQLGVPELTDEQWNELLRLVYLRREHWDQILEAGRRMSTSVQVEADYLLHTMLDYVQQAKHMYDARVERLEKDQQRAAKRLRTDFDKNQAALKAAESRVGLLVRELSILKMQQSSTPDPAHKAVSFNVALAQFFG